VFSVRPRNLATVLTAALLLAGCRKEAPSARPVPTGTAEPAAEPAEDKPLPEPAPAEGRPSADASRPSTPPTGRDTQQLPAGHPPIATRPKSAPQRSRPVVAAADGRLTVAGIRFDLPEAWEAQAPSSSMRLAQYSLPGEAGPAGMAVFAGIGGSAQANITRWTAQFKDPGNPHDQPVSEVEKFANGQLRLSIVRAEGIYSGTRTDPAAPPAKPEPDQALFGIIVEGGPQGILFIKVTGPKATVKSHDQVLSAFAQSAALAP